MWTNATTGSPVERPGMPPVLAPEGVVPQGPSRIDLTWDAFPTDYDDGGGEITGYKIEYSDSSESDVAEIDADTWMVLVANLNKTEDENDNTDDGTR